jgi:predicted proteasome-type protease
MTLVATLEGTNGLVVAADSRGTIGDPRGLTAINDTQTKLFRLSKWCGIGISGASELATTLIDGLTAKLDAHICSDEIARITQEHVNDQYTRWFGKRAWVAPQALRDDRPAIVFTVAGYNGGNDAPKDPRIWLLTSQLDFAPQLCPNGSMLIGIPQYATYLLHRLYDRRMNTEQLAALAAYLITETATQDPKVGGPVRMAKITKADGYTEVPQDAVEGIIKRNSEQNEKLRRFFYEEGRHV